MRPHPNHVTVGGLGLDTTDVVRLVDTAYTQFTSEPVPSPFSAPTGARLRNTHAYAAHTWSIAAPVEVTLGGRPFTIRKSFVEDVSAASLDAALAGLKRALLVLHAPLDQQVGIDNASAIFNLLRKDAVKA